LTLKKLQEAEAKCKFSAKTYPSTWAAIGPKVDDQFGVTADGHARLELQILAPMSRRIELPTPGHQLQVSF